MVLDIQLRSKANEVSLAIWSQTKVSITECIVKRNCSGKHHQALTSTEGMIIVYDTHDNICAVGVAYTYSRTHLELRIPLLKPTYFDYTWHQMIWFQRPEEDLSSGKLESTHSSRTVVKSFEFFFMKSSRLYAATLTHYSTEPLTTGPDYDPQLLLLALAGDVHPNTGPSRYPCSVCFKNVTSQGTSYLCTRCLHWVHSRCPGLRNAADYRKANGWICSTYMTPTQPRAPSPPPTRPQCQTSTFNILQWSANGIGNKQTELSIFLEAHNVKVADSQESKLTAKSRSQNIHNYNLVRQDRRQGPAGGLLFFYS